MLERSSAARSAISVFHENYNDIDIYVEDTAEGSEKIYARLLSRAVDSNLSLERVFPLGGRSNVIAEAKRTIASGSLERKSVYILDGDLYLLCGDNEELPPNSISLPRYCIENFLVDKKALVAVMYEEDPNKKIDEIESLLGYDQWINDNLPHLKNLFVCFAIAHKLDSGIPTVARGYKAIYSGGDGAIDHSKVDSVCLEIRTQLDKEFGVEAVREAEIEVLSNIDSDACFVRKYVSAKDFLLPLLLIRLRAVTKSKSPSTPLKIRFSGSCDTEPLRGVAQFIKDAMR